MLFLQELADVKFEAFSPKDLPCKLPNRLQEPPCEFPNRRPLMLLPLCSPGSPGIFSYTQLISPVAFFNDPSEMTSEEFEKSFGPIIVSFAAIQKSMYTQHTGESCEYGDSESEEFSTAYGPETANGQMSNRCSQDEGLIPSSSSPHIQDLPPSATARHQSLPSNVKLLEGTIHEHLSLKIPSGKLTDVAQLRTDPQHACQLLMYIFMCCNYVVSVYFILYTPTQMRKF